MDKREVRKSFSFSKSAKRKKIAISEKKSISQKFEVEKMIYMEQKKKKKTCSDLV